MAEKELRESKLKILQGFLLNPLRQRRIKEKLRKHPNLKMAYQEYVENMKSFGFETLNF